MTQAITSAKTSLRQVPALFKKFHTEVFNRNLDYGGGRYNDGTYYLNSKSIYTVVYDPFNRTEFHNQWSLSSVEFWKKDGFNFSVTLANVLNVIQKRVDREKIYEHIFLDLKPNQILISVYYDSRKEAGETSKGWQNHQKIQFYAEEMEVFFGRTYNVTYLTAQYLILERK